MSPLFLHFLKGMFHPSAEGEEDSTFSSSAQILGTVLAASWLLPASLYGRYIVLQGLSSPDLYRVAYSADWLMISTIVMAVVGVATATLWPALFVSRVDYMILGPLPISRMQLVSTKAAAAGCFMTGFVLALATCSCLVIPAIASGRWELRGMAVRVAGYAVSLYATGLFTFLGLLAVQAFLTGFLPARIAAAVGFAVRCLLLLLVICSVPLLQYFPASQAAAMHPSWLLRFPPAWFWGLGEWVALTRIDFTRELAHRAIIALAVALLLAVVTYFMSYLQQEKLCAEHVSRSRFPEAEPFAWIERRWLSSWSAGTIGFVLRTLVRSKPQASSLIVSFGIGLALAVESFVYVLFRGGRGSALQSAIAALPMTLSFFAMLGLRRAFCRACQLPANWIFRFLEVPRRRAEQLDATYAVTFFAGWSVILICFPFELAVFGWEAWAMLSLQLMAGWGMAEYLLAGWNTIPFTREPSPEKPHVLWRTVEHLCEYAAYGVIVPNLIRAGLSGVWVMVALGGILGTVLLYSRRRRLERWGKSPLEFVEQVPSVAEPIQLL